MKRLLSCLVIACFVSFAVTADAGWKDVTGYWVTIDDDSGKKKSIVKVYKKDGKIHGKIVKLLDNNAENPRCTECEGDKKNKPVKGLEIIWGMKPNKDEGVWEDGTILDPENGKKYDSKLWTEAGGDKLKVRGYVTVFYRTQTWKRTDAPDEASSDSKSDK